MAIGTFVIMLLVNQMHCRHGRQTYHHEAHLFEFYPRTPKVVIPDLPEGLAKDSTHATGLVSLWCVSSEDTNLLD